MSRFLTLVLCAVVAGCSRSKPAKSVPADSSSAGPVAKVRRVGQIARVRPEQIEQYKKLHEAMRPEVFQELHRFHVSNYSVYLKELEEDGHYLFSYFEYTGDAFKDDMTKVREDPTVRQWCDAIGGECLVKWSAETADWWADMEEVFFFAGNTDVPMDDSKAQRHGMVVGLRPEMVDSYESLHANAWPGVLSKIREANIRNYPIFLKEINGKYYLLSYFEYVGDDFDADMARPSADPATKAWEKLTDTGCQIPLTTRAEGERWAEMEQVFYYGGFPNSGRVQDLD
ncbi:MAG: L-rhamnose mutarotase [Planctomycetota bacterium]